MTFWFSVKRNKLTSCNIKLEAGAAHQLPTSERIGNQSATSMQLGQFEKPLQSFQYATYSTEQENHQMYSMQSSNIYPQDNQNIAPNVAMMPQLTQAINRNSNMDYVLDYAYGPVESHHLISNYPVYSMPPTPQQQQQPQPQPQPTALSNWRMPNDNNLRNTCYRHENNENDGYMMNAVKMNCNDQFNFNFNRNNGKHLNTELNFPDPLIIDNFNGSSNVDGNLSDSMTMVSLNNVP